MCGADKCLCFSHRHRPRAPGLVPSGPGTGLSADVDQLRIPRETDNGHAAILSSGSGNVNAQNTAAEPASQRPSAGEHHQRVRGHVEEHEMVGALSRNADRRPGVLVLFGWQAVGRPLRAAYWDTAVVKRIGKDPEQVAMALAQRFRSRCDGWDAGDAGRIGLWNPSPWPATSPTSSSI
jgi:hypothetical protein